jgi:transposase
VSDTPSYEQLVELVVALRAELAERDARIAELTERVAELERRLGQNSRNSSKPPSSDGPEAPTRRSRRGTGRRPGKQPGAPGSTLARVGCPDEIIDHVPDCCRRCRKDLAGAEPAGVVCRQVHDIPEIRPRVVEHRMHRRRRGCGQVTTAAASAGVSACVRYGPNVSALAVYLWVYQHIPVARTAKLIEQVCGLAVSTGWVCRALQVTAEALAEVEQTIKTLITLGHLVHVDETSTNITGARWWLHVASTQKLTAYALNVYDTYPATHALCGAHLVRERTAAAEAHPQQAWPHAALGALLGLNDAAHTARQAGLAQIPSAVADPLTHRWRHAILCGLAAHPRHDGRKQTKTRNLLERLRDRDHQVLRFARDPSVPFSNNQAERDLRPVKTQMKISGCARSETSARAWLCARGYISTARKHGINALAALRHAITGNPWKPTIPAPT